ncbi:MAG: hypothetical protein CME34_03145 [Gordonia sp.]|uniref:hypothetical protein n=1 Tax=Gordonia sp. (in: high G+C Gram-positive bacteria) TaxID=84139 RepID=UPI000C6BC5B6|nr:hypothetical protein [Gordonia sp. (in: high G+C Gram-positive bacteria)]MAU80866.1 hypothetical protein [Gordonia sp. (in: high G+C Gram-positive bacteria)]
MSDPSKYLLRRSASTMSARAAVAAVTMAAAAVSLLGCSSGQTPATSTVTSAPATAITEDGPVVPVTIPTVQAPAELRPGSRVQILGVDDAELVAPGQQRTYVAKVVAVRPHGDSVTVDLSPPGYTTDLGAPLANPRHPLTLIQLDAPSEDPS